MSVSAKRIAQGHAHGIARTMRMEASFENKPNHVRHVENQIAYADAVGDAVFEEMKEYIAQVVPKMI